jgi:hypothetical protein
MSGVKDMRLPLAPGSCHFYDKTANFYTKSMANHLPPPIFPRVSLKYPRQKQLK